MESKVLLSYILGAATVSGIWGTIFVHSDFAVLLIISVAITIICLVVWGSGNWDN